MRSTIKFTAFTAVVLSAFIVNARPSHALAPTDDDGCVTPSGGTCDAADCCVIDDACFNDCPIGAE